MSLFARGVERRSSTSAAIIPKNSELIPRAAGEPVTSDSALRLSAVWACVNLIANSVATLPWEAWRDAPDGSRAPAKPQPQIIANPDPLDPALTGIGWRRQVIISWLLRGNAYGLVTGEDAFARPTSVRWLHPDWVTVAAVGQPSTFRYVWRLFGKEIERWPNGPLLHLPAYEVPGLPVGLSPIEYAAEAIGAGIAAEKFGAKWFGEGSHPSAVLQSDQVLEDDTASSIKARFEAAQRGGRRVAVLGAGLTYQPIQVSPNESQFLETIRANKTDIAGFFQVPPDYIGGETGSSMTYANVTQRQLDLLTFAMMPWIARLEDFYNKATARPVYVRADVDEFLRVDPEARTKIQVEQVRAGLRYPNELRRKDGLEPVEDGDQINWPPWNVTPVAEEEAEEPATPGEAEGAEPKEGPA